MVYKLGDRIKFTNYDDAIVAEASRPRARRKKVCLICIRSGRNLGRNIEVLDFNGISQEDINRILGKKNV